MPSTNKKVWILWMLFAAATVLTVLPLIIGVIMALRQGIGGQYWNLFVQVVNQLYQPVLLGIVAWLLYKGRTNATIYCIALFLALWNTIVPLFSVSTVLFTPPGLSGVFASVSALGWLGYVYLAIIVLNWLAVAFASATLLFPDVRAYFNGGSSSMGMGSMDSMM